MFTRFFRSVFPILVLLLPALHASRPVLAQERKICTRWKHYCIDIYFVAPVIKGKNTLGKQRMFNKEVMNWRFPEIFIPPLTKSGDGIHEFTEEDNFPYADYLRNNLKIMLENMNRTAHPCKLWFSIRKVYFLDPGRIRTDGGRTLRQLFGAQDPYLNILYIDPAKTDALLNAARKVAKRISGKGARSKGPRCLSMFFVRFPDRASSNEAGRAATPGTVSVVDINAAFDRGRRSILPLHEILHNLGIRKHAKKGERPASREMPRRSEGGRKGEPKDVMAGKHVMREGRPFEPYINARHCRFLCEHDISAHGSSEGLAVPVLEAPPPKRVEPPAKEGASADDGRCGQTERIEERASRLPVPEFTDDELLAMKRRKLARFLREMTSAWLDALPERPEKCCNREILEAARKRIEKLIGKIDGLYGNARENLAAARKASAKRRYRDRKLNRLSDRRYRIVKALNRLKRRMLKEKSRLTGMLIEMGKGRDCTRKAPARVRHRKRRRPAGSGHRRTSRSHGRNTGKIIRFGISIGSGFLTHKRNKRRHERRRPERGLLRER